MLENVKTAVQRIQRVRSKRVNAIETTLPFTAIGEINRNNHKVRNRSPCRQYNDSGVNAVGAN